MDGHDRADAVTGLEEGKPRCVFCDIAVGRAEAVVLLTFEVLPSDLAGKILGLGRELAKRMKAVYTRTDITSARYLVGSPEVRWSPAHLRADRSTLLTVRNELGFMP
jgi:hypothetical protein